MFSLMYSTSLSCMHAIIARGSPDIVRCLDPPPFSGAAVCQGATGRAEPGAAGRERGVLLINSK